MASSDAQGNNYLPQVVIVTQNAEGANSSNGQSEATQSNSFNIVKGLVSVVFVCIVCGAYYMALMMADRVSVALFPVPPVIIVHALYLIIYAIEKCGFANEWYDDVTNLVETVGLVGNFFKPRPILFPSAQALLGNAASTLVAQYRAV